MQSYITPVGAQPDAGATFVDFHPVLRLMRATCERMFEAGDYERAFPILGALAVLNGKSSFWQPAAHEHFTREERKAVQL